MQCRCRGVGVDDEQAVDIHVFRARQALGHRVRQCPIPCGAAQCCRCLQRVGIGTGFQLEGAQAVKDRRDEAGPGIRFGVGLDQQLITPCALESLESLAAEFFGVVAEIEDHRCHAFPASIVRDNRMRCISMLPEDTVDACEYRQ